MYDWKVTPSVAIVTDGLVPVILITHHLNMIRSVMSNTYAFGSEYVAVINDIEVLANVGDVPERSNSSFVVIVTAGPAICAVSESVAINVSVSAATV